jgi:uncharacterized protein YkwD
MKPLFSLILMCTLFLSCSPNDEDITLYEEANNELLSTSVTYSSIELEILEIVNDYRIEENLSKLQTLNIISNVANQHTSYMIQTGTVSHANFSERAESLITNAKAKTVSENVAYGYSSAQAVFNGWLNSESHKKIIDNPNFTHFGISTDSDNQGKNYFTHIFIEK